MHEEHFSVSLQKWQLLWVQPINFLGPVVLPSNFWLLVVNSRQSASKGPLHLLQLSTHLTHLPTPSVHWRKFPVLEHWVHEWAPLTKRHMLQPDSQEVHAALTGSQ
jgi:hypothetical protein